MSDIDDIIEILFALFIALLLGYVFFLVFWGLNPALAIVFVLLVAAVIIGWLSEKLRG